MQTKIYLLGIIIIALLISGCSSKQSDFHVTLEKGYKPVKQLDYKLSSVTVEVVDKQKARGDLDIIVANYPLRFEHSLSRVLHETNMFINISKNDVKIKAKVLRHDIPNIPINIEVFTDVSYEIKSSDGKTIYSNVISSKGASSMDDSLVGLTRIVLANDRAVQNNIKLFIDDVQSKLQ
jgi:hypothetical protein